MSSAASPRPLSDVSLGLRALYANSPVAVAACFLIGLANGAWGTLGAVYGARAGVPVSGIALMMSLTVVAGAMLQIPAGRLSDKMDRRKVMIGAALGAALAGLAIYLLQPRGAIFIIGLSALYGAFAYILYSLAVAHANDHARPEDFVKVSGGLLLLYGFGTMAGPALAGQLMETLRPESIFLVTVSGHALLAGYAALRISIRPPAETRGAFQTMPADRSATPEAYRLDPRSDEQEIITVE